MVLVLVIVVAVALGLLVAIVWPSGGGRPSPTADDHEEMAGLVTANWDRIKDHF
jgi:hypothetical protein